ncbi:MAG: sigma-70 family RNA polymerase sigma factor [Pirellulaceae bacterium]|nr:sigma-70 family RNA polymerase sigma factor [Pirellulaceae bacterium]
MSDKSPTEILTAIQKGDPQGVEHLFPLVYETLKGIARNRLLKFDNAHGLSATELVHEAYIKLIDQKESTWKSRTHFFAVGSKVMRQIAVDRARSNLTQKRGGGVLHVPIEGDQISSKDDRHVLALEDALKRLEELDVKQAKIVELRFFGGMTVEEVAETIGMSKRWVEAEWTLIRAWLRKELSEM